MPSAQKRIRRLVEIHKAISQAGGISESQLASFQPELAKLKEEIISDLVWNPGLLVHVSDPVELQEAKNAVDQLWDRITSEDIWEEMTSGGYGGILASIIGDYSDRVVASRPTFVSFVPSTSGFGNFITEAFRCWLYGLDGAAVILCHSLLDTALYEAVGTDGSVMSLARKALAIRKIYRDDKKFIETINRHRNQIVHNLEPPPDSKRTHLIVIWTKEIVERLLQHQP